MTGRVSEGGSYPVDVEFLDDTDTPITPASVEYQITCLTNGKVVRDFTSVTPASTVRIVAEPTDNSIINDRNKREMKQMVVRSLTDDGLTKVDHHEWIVDNLWGVR